MTPYDPPQPDFTQVVRPGLRPEPRSEPSPERFVARYRAHGRRLFWPTVALVAIAGAGGYFVGRFPAEWQNIAALLVAALLAMLFWLLPTLRWLSTRYILTTRRVISVRGLVLRNRQEASLLRGHDVTLTRRGLQSLFRSGDVTVHSGSDHPLVLRDVPDAGLIVAALTELGDEAVGRA